MMKLLVLLPLSFVSIVSVIALAVMIDVQFFSKGAFVSGAQFHIWAWLLVLSFAACSIVSLSCVAGVRK
jgi:hypothetical protein